MDKAELVNLERLVHLLRGLSRAEVETLEILLDEELPELLSNPLGSCSETKGYQLMSGRPYQIFMAPSAHKRYKKFDSSLQQKIQQEASRIAEEPLNYAKKMIDPECWESPDLPNPGFRRGNFGKA